MIDYINKRLNEWARWRVSDRQAMRHALGAKNCWPAMLGESESTESVRQYGTLVPFDDLECLDTDRAVCALPPDLRTVVIEFYCRISTTEQVAKRCGISRMTLHRRIDQVHWHVLGSLNDLAAGVTLASGGTLPEKRACIA